MCRTFPYRPRLWNLTDLLHAPCHRCDMSDKRGVNWLWPGRMEALLTQVIAAGEESFLTYKANIKEEKTRGITGKVYKQRDVWMKEPDGIIPYKCDVFNKDIVYEGQSRTSVNSSNISLTHSQDLIHAYGPPRMYSYSTDRGDQGQMHRSRMLPYCIQACVHIRYLSARCQPSSTVQLERGGPSASCDSRGRARGSRSCRTPTRR